MKKNYDYLYLLKLVHSFFLILYLFIVHYQERVDYISELTTNTLPLNKCKHSHAKRTEKNQHKIDMSDLFVSHVEVSG